MEELNWDDARNWQEEANKDKTKHDEPVWEWDCSFKLDYDGPLISIASRFYPPHYNTNGLGWDGTLKMDLVGKVVLEKKFTCDTLDELKKEVEIFTEKYINKLKTVMSEIVIKD